MRARLLVIAVLTAALAVMAGCSGAPSAPDLIQIFPPEDREAAPELTGDLLDGDGQYDSAAHAGQVVVINFWASWCPPCVAEAPELETVYTAHKDSGVAFLGINVDDEIDSARAFARQHTTYPSIFDPSSRLALRFAVVPNAIPATIVLDRQGRIAAIARGAVVASELDPVVVGLLEETS